MAPPPSPRTSPMSMPPQSQPTASSSRSVIIPSPSTSPTSMGPPLARSPPSTLGSHIPARPSPLGTGAAALSRTISNPSPVIQRPSSSSPRPSAALLPDASRFSTGQSSRLTGTSSKSNLYGLSRSGSRGYNLALGIQDKLRRETDGVVKRRSGGVLGRGYILKTDHYPTGRAMDLDLTIQGAPNFRAPLEEGLNVFGVSWHCLTWRARTKD